MGDKPEEYEPGDSCVRCWGIGKPFGDYDTPKHIYMTGSGFPPECSNCNGTFVLTQDPIDPCYWWLFTAEVECQYQLDAIGSHFNMGGPVECFAFTGGVCTKTLTVMGRTVTVH